MSEAENAPYPNILILSLTSILGAARRRVLAR